MAIKKNQPRLYLVTAEWKYKTNIRTRDFIVCANNNDDAVIIAHNHLPISVTKSTKPSIYDDTDIKIYDLGPATKNRTYYAGPILTKQNKKGHYTTIKDTEKWLSRFSVLWGYEIGMRSSKPNQTPEEKQITLLLAGIEDTENLLRDWTSDYLETPVKNYKRFFDDKLKNLIYLLQK